MKITFSFLILFLLSAMCCEGGSTRRDITCTFPNGTSRPDGSPCVSRGGCSRSPSALRRRILLELRSGRRLLRFSAVMAQETLSRPSGTTPNHPLRHGPSPRGSGNHPSLVSHATMSKYG
ncbi:uncharacterized protein LOC119390394 [Rhipicephalus sanguineus]|uniref:uncharacterized protein LOC119390394 n=1 Tax=Rhipicephalus sanguineus TaxID=34632 RepID=UPI0020C4D05B|nr:uncharacterized protein LOC119390394 [Rhipicephalus sanguineus]